MAAIHSIPPAHYWLHPSRNRAGFNGDALLPSGTTFIRAHSFIKPRGDFLRRGTRDDPYRIAKWPLGRIEHCDLHPNIGDAWTGSNTFQELVKLRGGRRRVEVATDAPINIVALEELREGEERPRRGRFVDVAIARNAFSDSFEWCHV